MLTSCAATSEQASVQDEVSLPTKPEPKILLQDELLNAPPNEPRYVIAQPAVDAGEHFIIEQTITDAMRRQLGQLGYAEAESRDDANVVVWYSFESEQTGKRLVGQANDTWGEKVEPVSGANTFDASSVQPVAFNVEIISLKESYFPHKVFPIWKGEWSSSLAVSNLVEFANTTLPEVFNQYQSAQTQGLIAKFRQAHEKRVKHAINTYMKMVMYRIQKNWKKPKHKVKGKTCKIKIVQSAVGEIKSHELITCDRDRRFRRSIEKAIKASSPLPLPREHVFDRRELILIFQG